MFLAFLNRYHFERRNLTFSHLGTDLFKNTDLNPTGISSLTTSAELVSHKFSAIESTGQIDSFFFCFQNLLVPGLELSHAMRGFYQPFGLEEICYTEVLNSF